MGPFCYNVFTNDMLSILNDNIEIYNYADDNTLICTGYNYDEVKMDLLVAVDKVILWFNDNFMKVNPDKFQCIAFGNVANPGTFQINGTSVNVEKSVKLLGLHIDNKLNFRKYVSQICQKAGRQVQVLCRLSRVLNSMNKLLLNNSFIECYFNYCCVLWHFCSNADTFKVEKIQEKALRFSMLYFRSSYSQLLHACDKSTLYTGRMRKLVEVVYRAIYLIYPAYLHSIVNLRVAIA